MISGYSGNGKINDALLVPNFYDKFCFTWSWFDGEQTANYDWDFSQYQPELIVVNLGTNDNSYTKGDPDKCAEFEKGYVNFLKEIRAKNPNSEILCTLGIMGQELYPSITDAVDTYKTETGDSKVSVSSSAFRTAKTMVMQLTITHQLFHRRQQLMSLHMLLKAFTAGRELSWLTTALTK